MALRYDRVHRLDYDDGDQVYSLILNDDGLYLLRTGNVGGLLNDQGNAMADPVVLDETTRPFIEEILDFEARINKMPVAALAAEPGSVFLPFDAIEQVELGEIQAETYRSTDAVLHLETTQGVFDLRFTYSRDEDVAMLARLLQGEMRPSPRD